MERKNKAEKYLMRARKSYQNGNLEEAMKLIEKSKILHPSVNAEELLAQVKQGLSKAGPSSKSQSSGNANGARRNVPNAKKPSSNVSQNDIPSTSDDVVMRAIPDKPASPNSESTPAQRAAVNRILVIISEIKILTKENKEACRKILGVPDNASDDDIRKSFKRLALLLHPDKSQLPGTVEACKAINAAKAILLNDEPPEKDTEFYTTNVEPQRSWTVDDDTAALLIATMVAGGVAIGTFKLVNYLIDRFRSKDTSAAQRK